MQQYERAKGIGVTDPMENRKMWVTDPMENRKMRVTDPRKTGECG